MNTKELRFLKGLGQTSPFPFLIDVAHAEGLMITDKNGKKFMDMIAGVSVNNIGNRHPKVVAAIKKQCDQYLHTMVYGEFIQDPVLEMAEKLIALLPEKLNCVYPVNSGTEANEAAIKLVKRVTQRSEIVSFRGSYHGSTNGSLSISGNEIKKAVFRPLLPDVRFLQLNNFENLDQISEKTAGVILETIQGDAGVRRAETKFLKALRAKCDEVGALLVFDEIQCGLGRAGSMFAFEQAEVVPDVLTLGKALGGGLPIGALVSSLENLNQFSENPMLGHITTFGGNPVVCAAASAFLEVMQTEIDFQEVEQKGKRLVEIIGENPEIKAIRREGMMFAFDMESGERVAKVVDRCLELGIITFWFLSHPYSFRLSPPLNITWEEIETAGSLIRQAIEETAA